MYDSNLPLPLPLTLTTDPNPNPNPSPNPNPNQVAPEDADRCTEGRFGITLTEVRARCLPAVRPARPLPLSRPL